MYVCVFVCFHVRLLEGDQRCHTKIIGRSGSDTSTQSAKSANSHRNSLVEVEGQQDATSTVGIRKALPLHTQTSLSDDEKLTTPPSSPETPVKSKPAAPYLNEDLTESSEGEGLGPEASIILDDGLNTRIDLDVVLPTEEEGVACGSGLEDETELEVPNEPGSDQKELPLSTTNEISRTSSLAAAEQLPGKQSNGSSEGSEGDAGEEVAGEKVEEAEERDVLPDLKPGRTVKRGRSETEAGRKVSLASLVGRVRSQTIQDGGLKEKHLSNKVRERERDVGEKQTDREREGEGVATCSLLCVCVCVYKSMYIHERVFA